VLRMLDRIPPTQPLPSTRTFHRCPTFNEWALEQMYAARNDYLHGNPVESERLLMPGTTFDISVYASLMYRLLLSEFLGLQQELVIVPKDSEDYANQQGKAIAQWIEVNSYGKRIKNALYTMTGHSRRP
jgi:hypothetical protein